MKQDLISIIVPIYNVQKFLGQTLRSLINQSYQKLEIICVNDGSTDGCLQILEEFASNDDRIIVINKLNSGVSAARTDAVAIACGEYLMFVDGDDWLENDACKVLINTMHTYDPDVVMYTYYREYEDRTLKKDIYPHDLIIFDEQQCHQLHRRHAGIIGDELREPQNADAICSLWTKMYKTEIFRNNHIRFVDLKIIGTYEDGLVNLYYYEHVHKAVYINRHLYHYRKYNESSVTAVYKKNLNHQWNNLYEIIQNYISEKQYGDDFREGLRNRIALGSIGLGLNELLSDKSYFGKIKTIRAILSDPRYHDAVKKLPARQMPLHWKIYFLSCKMKLSTSVYLLLLIILKLKSKV